MRSWKPTPKEPTCEHGVTLPKLVGGRYLAACYCDRNATVPVFSGAGECVLCQRPTVGSVHGEPVCGECEDRMAAETRDEP